MKKWLMKTNLLLLLSLTLNVSNGQFTLDDATVSVFNNAVPPVVASDWDYSTPLTVSNQTAVALSDYPVKISVTYSNGMDLYFEDVRFQAGGTTFTHWMYDVWPSNSAKFWVRVPVIPASATTNLTMIYGNASAVDVSDGDATFDLFDDFGGQAWKRLRDMPDGKQQHGFEALDGKLYAVAGGGGSTAVTNTMFAYDIAGDEWTIKAVVPVINQSPAVRAVGTNLYHIGGLLSDFNTTTNGVFKYNQVTDSWAQMTAMPLAVEDLGSVVVSNRYIYVVGGWGPASPSLYVHNTIQSYDTVLDSWSTNYATMPSWGRCLGDMCAIDTNGLIYVVSSVTNMATYPVIVGTTRLDIYDTVANTWSTGATVLRGVSYKECEVKNGILYTVGGSTTNTPTAKSWVQGYHIDENRWRYKSMLPTPRAAAGMAQWGDYLYVSGGHTNTTAGTTNALWRYTPSLDVSNTPSAAKWTVTLKGTNSAIAETREGQLHLDGFNTVLASANLISTATFTNGFALEVRRATLGDSTSYYMHAGFGAGTLVDYNGWSSNWFMTFPQSGYSALVVNTTTASIRKMPASGTNLVIGSNFTPTTLVSDGPPSDISFSYDSDGVLTWLVSGVQVDTATDTTFLSTAKKITLSQGSFTTTGLGGETWYEWVFVRKRATLDPGVYW